MANGLDLELLQTLIAIAETGAFTRAAERVHRSQSAISMQMKKLEELTGRPLFEKSGRGVSLTSDGDTLVGYARRMSRLQAEALSALQLPDMKGNVSIGIPDDYVACFLPGILTGFAGTFPLVHVEVRCEPSDELLVAVARNEIDLALVTEKPGHVRGQVLRREPVVWVTSRQHHAHEQDPLPLAVFQKDCFFHDWAVGALDSAGRRHRIAYTSPSITGIEAVVTAGLAIATLPQSVVCCDMRELTREEGFDPLQEAVITLHRSAKARGEVVETLAHHIGEGLVGAREMAA